MLEWRFSRGYLPEDDSVAEDISLFAVFLAGNDLRRHPLIRSDLASHIVVESLRPSEVSQLHSSTLIQEEVETLEIAVKHWRIAGVKIVDSLGCLQRHSSSLLPTEWDLQILNVGP